MLVAPGTVIALTRPLFVCDDLDAFFQKYSGMKRENYHCERRPSLRSAGCGGGWG